MTNPEIKVGQKYRVVDAASFGYFGGRVRDGDIVVVTERQSPLSNYYLENLTRGTARGILLYSEDIEFGHLALIEDVQEASEDVSALHYSDTPENTENVSQASTEAPESIQSGLSAELLWKFIEGSSEYNGHKQFEVDELSWDVLKDAVKTLGEYLENDEDTLATSLEIRLMYNGNLSGKFKHTWGASVYQLDYWKDGEHKDGHRDRLLFGVEIVRGI